jgi:hypothetical protein
VTTRPASAVMTPKYGGTTRCCGGQSASSSTTTPSTSAVVYYGPDVAAALDWVRGFTCTHEVLKRLDPAAATYAVERLREALATHLGDDGVWFDSRAWIVTARRH